MNGLDLGLVLILAGLVAAAIFLKKSPDLRRQVSIVLSLAALGIVVLRAIQTPAESSRAPGEETFDGHWASAWKLGQILTEDLPEGGTVLVLQATSVAPAQERLSAVQVEGLRSGLLSIGFDLIIRAADGASAADPPYMSTHMLSADLLQTSVAKYTNLSAVVAFGELPLDELDASTLPPLYVTDPFSTEYWKAWLEQGHIRAAISPRVDSVPVDTSMPSHNPGAVFDATFSAARATSSP